MIYIYISYIYKYVSTKHQQLTTVNIHLYGVYEEEILINLDYRLKVIGYTVNIRK